MAIATTIDVSRLDEGWILAPERYDPRRRHASHEGAYLSDVVDIIRDQISSSKADPNESFLVLDTGDAHNGIIKTGKPSCGADGIGSTKKRIHPGQVIISRLRPYLRQVAWVDSGIQELQADGTSLLCSTEFFVLKSKDKDSIAFLVPFLLSEQVQTVLAASQEGGHHPRFNEQVLKTLPVPSRLIECRAELSAKVEGAVRQARNAYGSLASYIYAVENTFATTE